MRTGRRSAPARAAKALRLADEDVRAALASRRGRLLVLQAVVGTAAVCALHLAHTAATRGSGPAWLTRDSFSIEHDRGLAELVEAVWLVCGAVALLSSRHDSARLRLVLAAFCAFLVFDNLLELHERIAWRVATPDPAATGVRGSDLAEVAVFALVGVAAGTAFTVAARRDGGVAPGLRAPLVGFALLGLAAVPLDLAHRVAGELGLGTTAAIVEDGTEHLLVACIGALLVAGARRRSPP